MWDVYKRLCQGRQAVEDYEREECSTTSKSNEKRGKMFSWILSNEDYTCCW